MPAGSSAHRAVLGLLQRLSGPWRHMVTAVLIGMAGALAVDLFSGTMSAVEAALTGLRTEDMVSVARALPAPWRVLLPTAGALVAGTLLHWRNARVSRLPPETAGDFIEAVKIGDGRLDEAGGLVKVAASWCVICSGGAIGRAGAFTLLSSVLASFLARPFRPVIDGRLAVSCGAAAGLAAAFHAPLAASMFVAEILTGTLAIQRISPVIVAAVTAHAFHLILGHPAVLFPVSLPMTTDLPQALLVMALSVPGGVAGAAVLRGFEAVHTAFVRSRLPLPARFALGGLIVGLLSLAAPQVWGNGLSVIADLIVQPDVPAAALALVLALKVLGIAATTGSGAPGGIFMPTLFIGATAGALAAAALQGAGLPAAGLAITPTLYVVAGMAVLLAATTHAPVMAAIMVFEMTGRYDLLPLMLPAGVVAALVSTRLHRRSMYGIDAAPGPPG